MTDIKHLIVTSELTVREALHRMNEGRAGILLVVNQDGVLKRTITDGDLRRLLLDGGDFEDVISSLPDKSPITALVGMPDTTLAALMREHKINHIPLVNEKGIPLSLIHLHDIEPPILLSTPHMGEAELEYVTEAFNANWIAPLGPNVDAFEQELAEKVGVANAAAVNSGTAAIHLALVLLGVGSGDKVFCSALTFVASANPILYQGAIPVFIDSEPESWNMSPNALERAMSEAQSDGSLPKAVVVVNLYGQSADYKPICDICDHYGVAIIEDAAESLGASYREKSSGTLGLIGIFSFNGNKIITTSGGGMLVSDDEELVKRAKHLSTQAKEPFPYYHHVEVGYNYRMSNILAGIGRGQLKVLDDRVKARRKVFQRYVNLLSDVESIAWMPEKDYGTATRWLTTATIDPEISHVNSKDVIQELNNSGIEARHVWKPMHMQPIFKENLYYPHSEHESISDRLFKQGICLPSSSHLSMNQQERVANALKQLIM